MSASTAAQRKHDHEDDASFVDPVCGMKVDPMTAKFRHVHDVGKFFSAPTTARPSSRRIPSTTWMVAI